MKNMPLRFYKGHMKLIFCFWFEIILTSLYPGIGLYIPYTSLIFFLILA